MKSIFTKLSTLLLCGAVAMVSCTDFSEDIQNLDNKVNNLGNTTQTELATLQKAITDLEAKLSAQYATKDEVAALKTTLENSIASEVAALSEDIAEVSAALNAAKNEINTAIAGLDEKKADKAAVEAAVKTATEAIAALQAELEAAKGDLEAEIASVKEQIAATQESLQEQINGVDAKANELQNTLLSLGDYLKTLEAKVNEINNTLLSLGEYLPTIEAKILEVKGTVESLGAEYEANKEVVDAKLTELFSTLVSLSNHLEEYEATTDFKLVELQGSLAALSTYLEEYEASVDAKFNEILNTFESLSLFLDEKFAALEATDTDLYTEIEGIRVVLSALNNLLTDETAARESEDAALYELIGSSVTALNNLIADLAAEDEAIYAELDGVRQAFTTLNNLLSDEAATREAEDAAIYELIGSSVTALNNLIADLEAEDEAIYAEIENVRTYVAQVYNALSTEIAAVDAALQAHIAAFEAFKEAYEAKVDELEATDEDLYVEINGLREVITTINNHIDDLRAEDEAIYLEINGLRENLTQLQNAINNRIDEEVKTLKDEILEKFNILNTVILETEKRVNDKFNHTLKLIAENTELILANAAAIADLEAAVEMLMDWVAGQEENNELQAELIAKVYEIVGEMEEQIAALTQKDNELEGLIGKTAGALQTYMDENDARLADLELFINENINSLGAGIRNLEAIINDLEARFGARLDALEERMDAAEGKIADLEEQAAAMAEAIENIEAAIEDLEAMDEALAAEIANVDAAAKAELKKARKELQDQIDALVEAKEDLQVRVAVLEELVADNTANIENNRKEIEANITAISNAVKQLGSLQATVNAMIQSSAIIDSALQAKDIELQKNIDAAVADLAAAVARIGAVEDAVKALQELAETLATKAELKDEVAKIEKKMTDIQNMLLTLITASEDRANDKINHLRELVADANELIDELRGDVNTLFARVQSLVYVPEYADHKATIEYAVISQYEMENDRPAEAYAEGEDGKQLPYTYVAKASDLKYLVKADNAAEVAEAIAKNWASVLDYEVKDVKTTRAASETGADLEIVKVKAEGEYIIVSVVAKNFDAKFFQKRKIGGIYSAALVLADENNTRTTEYTNLVPGTPVNYVAKVLDGDDNDITWRTWDDTNTPVARLPYDRDPAERIILEGHRLAFFAGEEINTADDLIAAGYDIQLERRVYQKVLGTDEYQDHLITLKKGEVENRQVGKFELREDPLTSITAENDTYVKIREEMTKETYKALKAKNEHILTIDYIYNINGVTVNTQASAEICNRLVEVNIETIVPWTLETIQKHSNGAYLNQSLKGTIKYDLTPGADANKDLMGYKLLAIANASYAPEHADYKLRLENENSNESTIGFELINKGDAKYDFPMNDGDDEKDTYNKYTRTYTANFDDVDVVLTATVKLAERPADQVVKTKEPVTFTTGNGDNILFGYWDAAQAAYEQFLPYIGYTDQPEVGKAKFFEAIQYGNYNYAGDMPIVNGKKGVAANVNAPFKAGDHKFQLYKSQLGGQTYVDGTTHTIVQEVRPYFHVPFTFNVNGVVDLPDYALDLDPVRVLNRGEEKIVEVKGEIANNVYTVDVSDLAKYYYVVNKEGEKSLTQVNPNDNLNVDFSLSPMEGAEEAGYNFNADPAVTEYTLGVDWTGTLSDVPYILPMKKAVVNWGTYPHTEVGVNALLSVNGFPIVAKPITLVTEDPLEIALKDVTVEVTHLSGTNPQPVVAKVYQNFELYSAVEEGNLFNNNAKTIGGLWFYSKADKTYGVTMNLEFNRVYYKVGENEIGWDESKIVLEKYTTENLVAPYKVGDLTGNLYIKADDGDIQTPIYVEFNVVMTHNIHDGAKTKCETEGVVTVKFVPEGYVEVAE